MERQRGSLNSDTITIHSITGQWISGKGARFPITARWLQGQLSLSSFQGRLNEYQELLWTEW